MLLLITQAGLALESDALQNGTAIPALKEMVVDMGISVDGETIAHQAYVAAITAIDNVAPGTLKLYASIPPSIQTWIKGIALRLEDGTVYAYGRYQEPYGFYKNLGFAFSFSAVLSFSQNVSLTFTYSPLDIGALAAQIIDSASQQITDYIDATIVQGTGGGFDADKLDGKHASQFQLLIAQGAGGGFDADKLDGKQGSDYLTWDDANTYSGAFIPVGGIIMWSGAIADVPTNFRLCNGLNGTPDLRGKFVIGANHDYSGAAHTNITGVSSITGGSKDAVVVSHSHTVAALSAGTEWGYGDVVTEQDARLSGTTTNSSTEGTDGTNKNLPPYYALAFIMRFA